MATTSERLTLLITADVKGAVKGFEKVGKSADRELNRAQDKLDKTAARLTKMGATALAAGGIMAAALASTIGPASDLNEAINVSQLVFGEASEAMEDWAATAAKSIGQSKRAALEGAAAIGGLLLNVGFLKDEVGPLSQDLVVLASDMASAFNTDPAQALEALRSGLSGQSEPLRKYNIFLSEAALKLKAVEIGLGDGTAKLSENEKAQARLAIITEQTAIITGDFAATSEGAANAQRVLAAQFEDTKAAIGQAVLPLFEKLLANLNKLFGAFNSLSPEAKELIGKLVLMSTAFAALGGGMLLVAGQAIKMRKTFKDLSPVMKKSTLAAGGFFAAFVIGTAVFDAFQDGARKAEERILAMAIALDAANTPIEGIIDRITEISEEEKGLRNLFATVGPEGIRDFARALTDSESSFGDLTDILKGYGLNVDQAIILTKRLRDEFEGSADAAAGMADVLGDDLDDGVDNSREAIKRLTEQNAAFEDSTKAAGRATKGMSGRLKNASTKLQGVADAAEDATDKLGDYFDIVKDTTQLVIDWERSIDDAVEAQKDNKLATDRNSEAGVDNLEVGLDLLGVLEDVIQAKFDETGVTEEAVVAGQEFVDQLKEELIAAGFTKEAVDEFVDTLNLVPGDYTATLEVEDTQAIRDAKAFQDLLETIDKMVVAPEIRGFIAAGGGLGGGGGDGVTASRFQAQRLRRGGGFDPSGSFFVQRAKAGDDSLKQATIDVASSKADLVQGRADLKQARADLAQAKKDIAAAKESGDEDALVAARSERDAARADRDAAREDIARATAAQIEAERRVAEANKDIADARRGLEISQALARGDTVKARQLGVDQAKADLAFAVGQGGGEADILSARAAIVNAEASLKSAVERVALDVLKQMQAAQKAANAAVGNFAHGGIIKARPGGTVIRVGEGGRDEGVFPLGRNGAMMGRTVNQTITVNAAPGMSPEDVADAVAKATRLGFM